jgi:hypothetical protein
MRTADATGFQIIENTAAERCPPVAINEEVIVPAVGPLPAWHFTSGQRIVSEQ